MPAEPLWTPSPERVAASNLTRFAALLASREGVVFSGYADLHAYSVARPEAFWRAVWDFTGVVAERVGEAVLDGRAMPGARWFPQARLNFSENLLRFRDDHVALVAIDEVGGREVLTYAALAEQVRRLAARLRAWGVEPGDRVAAFFPNRPEAVVAMLAAASLGAVFSSCSPDFGFNGVMDRFGQIAPKVLLTADAVRYGGRSFDSLDRVRRVVEAIPSIERVIVVPLAAGAPELGGLRGACTWREALDVEAPTLDFAALPFDHPLYILYSSGTTGVPKCIVHGAGGTLLQHAKELVLHADLRREDVVFYFTTCGWMMWNWLVSALFTGATVVLYDGSPAHPDASVLWRMAEAEGVTVFGTSPKFLSVCDKEDLHPGRDHALRIRTVLSTGAPLSEDGFRWVYERVGADLQLASISGGTDIVSCFMLGSPWDPVYAGEIQRRGLGMAVDAWSEEARPVVGEKGELVCTGPFPSMPVGFWGDADGSRYRRAYFEHFPGVWRHGDYVEITERGGVIVHGRSDATLNPGGVRIGTAEIYRQVEALDDVLDSVVIGQRWEDDTRVVLFVTLRPGLTLDDGLRARIRAAIRERTTPRHVPAVIAQVPAIPRTLSGKKVELAVARVVHGEPVTNRDALANPEALEAFVDHPDLRA